MGLKTEHFYARIFGKGEDDYQDVYVYIYHKENDVADCEIKMPMLIEPTSLRGDVETWLWEHDFSLSLGFLQYTLAPKNVMIYP